MVTGPAAAICDACAFLSNNIVAIKGDKEPVESKLYEPNDTLRNEVYALIRKRLGYTKTD